MKILYIARHDQTGTNDDEGAIAHVLGKLGHPVIRVQETSKIKPWKHDADVCLFHHWSDIDAIREIAIPKVFWCFDLIDYPDKTLSHRNERRKEWMGRVTPLVDIGFCTDGDWVANDTSGKLVQLMQGADERVMGPGDEGGRLDKDIVFVGGTHGGWEREHCVYSLQQRYGKRFMAVSRGVHGRALANLLSTVPIAIAPTGPVTDRYWSNRVYMTLGFGGFLLHPYAADLTRHYAPGTELTYYQGQDDLHQKIDHFLKYPAERRLIQARALKRTTEEHTYRHRCERLIQVITERIFNRSKDGT